jgi:hypothetical protein
VVGHGGGGGRRRGRGGGRDGDDHPGRGRQRRGADRGANDDAEAEHGKHGDRHVARARQAQAARRGGGRGRVGERRDDRGRGQQPAHALGQLALALAAGDAVALADVQARGAA